MWVLYPGRVRIWSVSFCGGRKSENPELNPRNKARTNNKLIHYSNMALGRNRTRATHINLCDCMATSLQPHGTRPTPGCKTLLHQSSSPLYPAGGGGGGTAIYGLYRCRCEGYRFQAVSSRIGYTNQSVWV